MRRGNLQHTGAVEGWVGEGNTRSPGYVEHSGSSLRSDQTISLENYSWDLYWCGALKSSRWGHGDREVGTWVQTSFGQSNLCVICLHSSVHRLAPLGRKPTPLTPSTCKCIEWPSSHHAQVPLAHHHIQVRQTSLFEVENTIQLPQESASVDNDRLWGWILAGCSTGCSQIFRSGLRSVSEQILSAIKAVTHHGALSQPWSGHRDHKRTTMLQAPQRTDKQARTSGRRAQRSKCMHGNIGCSSAVQASRYDISRY